jgi:hypothetical protein
VSARRAALLAAALGCGLAEPAPLVRVVGAEPAGDAVPPGATFSVRFTGAIAPGSIGGRIAIAAEADLRAALAAVESDAGAAFGAPVVAARAALAEGGTRVDLAPETPLVAGAAYVLLVSSRLRAADGRAVLDPEGHLAPFVHAFATGSPPGPPPLPVLLEVLVDAATPEAGGEYAEVGNLGDGLMDLRGHRLAKRTATGTLTTCSLSLAAGGPVGPGGYALVVGGAWDGRYALPAGTALYACGATALLGGIANDRPAEILLLSPSGEAVTTLGAGGSAPVCVDLERVHPLAPDGPLNLACAEEGTPGACNAATPADECP